ncbi:VOC family protein [Cystobacter ferrugineus]|uniref:Bleomycin resistance protein n=1 Tax=Cystobacter ferrugineus TaxID=83449 RepID=A0A1L9B0Z7_9BACT|nr:VOC family protein [Cystobacter ferrugineus]OJH35939.1 bleomycin resistance protein [Cystobacter ferrugineus]
MTVSVTNHLNFRGDARAALEFYQSVFGGDITIVTYKDAQSVQVPSEANQVMWGQVAAKNGFRVMAYDVPSRMPWDEGKNAFFVSVRGDSDKEITALWEKLSVGATVAQPLAPSGWAPLYGMLKDRFGITWVLDVATQYKAS